MLAQPVENLARLGYVSTALSEVFLVLLEFRPVDVEAPGEVQAVFQGLLRPVARRDDYPQAPACQTTPEAQERNLGVHEPELSIQRRAQRQVGDARHIKHRDRLVEWIEHHPKHQLPVAGPGATPCPSSRSRP